MKSQDLERVRARTIKYKKELDKPGEMWEPTEGYPGYEVSSTGRVRSYWTRGRGSHISKKPQCIFTPYINPAGYNQVSLKRNCSNHASRVCIYTLVARAFLGPRPSPELEICHNDGNSQNDIPTNLRYDTVSSNQLDAVKHGKYKASPGANWKNWKKNLAIEILKITLT